MTTTTSKLTADPPPYSCSLLYFPVEEFELNTSNGNSWSLWNGSTDNEEDLARRLEKVLDANSNLTIDDSASLGIAPDSALTFKGRRCACSSPREDTSLYYCPVESTICIIETANGVESVYCSGDSLNTFNRFALPFVVFVCFFFTVLCFFNPRGRYAREFTKSILYRYSEEEYERQLNQQLNEMMATSQQLWQRSVAQQQAQEQDQRRVYFPMDTNRPRVADLLARPQVRQQLRQQQMEVREASNLRALQLRLQRRNREQDPDQSAEPLRSVGVKTRRYDRAEVVDRGSSLETAIAVSSSPLEEPEHAAMCSICLTEVLDGARIADLGCCHLYHSACLKGWIRQGKRTCPLCQASIHLITNWPADGSTDATPTARHEPNLAPAAV